MSDTPATSQDRLRVGDLIDQRVAEQLGIPVTQITDQIVADCLDVSRETVSRWRHGHNRPGGLKLLDIARQLEVPVEQLIAAAGE